MIERNIGLGAEESLEPLSPPPMLGWRTNAIYYELNNLYRAVQIWKYAPGSNRNLEGNADFLKS